MLIGSKKYIEMKEAVADSLIRELPLALQSINGYAENAMDIRNTLTTKMQKLTAEQFEGMLRPVFKEDEWILIAVGAEIGRASCRERVCEYVWISVVAGVLKKKKKE